MNKLLALSSGLLLALAPLASAQESKPVSPGIRLTPPVNPERPFSAALGVKPDGDKPGAYMVQPGRYEIKDLLSTLAKLSGEKALFDDRVEGKTVVFGGTIRGNVSGLIRYVAERDLIVGHSGENWMFLPNPHPVTPASVLPLFQLPPIQTAPAVPEKVRPDERFNINPNPGQNLPDNVTPFEFNGSKLYHVPLK